MSQLFHSLLGHGDFTANRTFLTLGQAGGRTGGCYGGNDLLSVTLGIQRLLFGVAAVLAGTAILDVAVLVAGRQYDVSSLVLDRQLVAQSGNHLSRGSLFTDCASTGTALTILGTGGVLLDDRIAPVMSPGHGLGSGRTAAVRLAGKGAHTVGFGLTVGCGGHLTVVPIVASSRDIAFAALCQPGSQIINRLGTTDIGVIGLAVGTIPIRLMTGILTSRCHRFGSIAIFGIMASGWLIHSIGVAGIILTGEGLHTNFSTLGVGGHNTIIPVMVGGGHRLCIGVVGVILTGIGLHTIHSTGGIGGHFAHIIMADRSAVSIAILCQPITQSGLITDGDGAVRVGVINLAVGAIPVGIVTDTITSGGLFIGSLIILGGMAGSIHITGLIMVTASAVAAFSTLGGTPGRRSLNPSTHAVTGGSHRLGIGVAGIVLTGKGLHTLALTAGSSSHFTLVIMAERLDVSGAVLCQPTVQILDDIVALAVRVILLAVGAIPIGQMAGFLTGGIHSSGSLLVCGVMTQRLCCHGVTADLDFAGLHRTVNHDVIAATCGTGSRYLILRNRLTGSVTRRSRYSLLAGEFCITDGTVDHSLIAAVYQTGSGHIVLDHCLARGVARGGHSLSLGMATIILTGIGLHAIHSTGGIGSHSSFVPVMVGGSHRLGIGVGGIVLTGKGLHTLALTAGSSGHFTHIIMADRSAVSIAALCQPVAQSGLITDGDGAVRVGVISLAVGAVPIRQMADALTGSIHSNYSVFIVGIMAGSIHRLGIGVGGIVLTGKGLHTGLGTGGISGHFAHIVMADGSHRLGIGVAGIVLTGKGLHTLALTAGSSGHFTLVIMAERLDVSVSALCLPAVQILDGIVALAVRVILLAVGAVPVGQMAGFLTGGIHSSGSLLVCGVMTQRLCCHGVTADLDFAGLHRTVNHDVIAATCSTGRIHHVFLHSLTGGMTGSGNNPGLTGQLCSTDRTIDHFIVAAVYQTDSGHIVLDHCLARGVAGGGHSLSLGMAGIILTGVSLHTCALTAGNRGHNTLIPGVIGGIHIVILIVVAAYGTGIGGVTLILTGGRSHNRFIAVAGGGHIVIHITDTTIGVLTGIGSIALSSTGGRSHNRPIVVAGFLHRLGLGVACVRLTGIGLYAGFGTGGILGHSTLIPVVPLGGNRLLWHSNNTANRALLTLGQAGTLTGGSHGGNNFLSMTGGIHSSGHTGDFLLTHGAVDYGVVAAAAGTGCFHLVLDHGSAVGVAGGRNLSLRRGNSTAGRTLLALRQAGGLTAGSLGGDYFLGMRQLVDLLRLGMAAIRGLAVPLPGAFLLTGRILGHKPIAPSVSVGGNHFLGHGERAADRTLLARGQTGVGTSRILGGDIHLGVAGSTDGLGLGMAGIVLTGKGLHALTLTTGSGGHLALVPIVALSGDLGLRYGNSTADRALLAFRQAGTLTGGSHGGDHFLGVALGRNFSLRHGNGAADGTLLARGQAGVGAIRLHSRNDLRSVAGSADGLGLGMLGVVLAGKGLHALALTAGSGGHSALIPIVVGGLLGGVNAGLFRTADGTIRYSVIAAVLVTGGIGLVFNHGGAGGMSEGGDDHALAGNHIAAGRAFDHTGSCAGSSTGGIGGRCNHSLTRLMTSGNGFLRHGNRAAAVALFACSQAGFGASGFLGNEVYLIVTQRIHCNLLTGEFFLTGRNRTIHDAVMAATGGTGSSNYVFLYSGAGGMAGGGLAFHFLGLHGTCTVNAVPLHTAVSNKTSCLTGGIGFNRVSPHVQIPLSVGIVVGLDNRSGGRAKNTGVVGVHINVAVFIPQLDRGQRELNFVRGGTSLLQLGGVRLITAAYHSGTHSLTGTHHISATGSGRQGSVRIGNSALGGIDIAIGGIHGALDHDFSIYQIAGFSPISLPGRIGQRQN